MKAYTMDSLIGQLGITEEDGSITNVFFGMKLPDGAQSVQPGENSIIDIAVLQLKEYFDGKRKKFDLPLKPVGTPFMQSVYAQLLKVPYGETAGYKDIAELIGRPKAARAVGLANNRNSIPIFIPCHRIVGSNGKLVGYAGGLEIKQKLLQLESKYK